MAFSLSSCGDDAEDGSDGGSTPDTTNEITVKDLAGIWEADNDWGVSFCLNADGTGAGSETDDKLGVSIVHDAWRVRLTVNNGTIKVYAPDGEDEVQTFEIVSLENNVLRVIYDDYGDTELVTLRRVSTKTPGNVQEFTKSKVQGAWVHESLGYGYLLKANGIGYGYEHDDYKSERWNITWSLNGNYLTITEDIEGENNDVYVFKVLMVAPTFAKLQNPQDGNEEYFTLVDENFLTYYLQ